MHAFYDASLKAFGAVIYIRTHVPGDAVRVTLLTSKSKLADLQSITIPRMEMCWDKLAAELAQRCKEILGYEHLDVVYWTDSEMVLHLLRKLPSKTGG